MGQAAPPHMRDLVSRRVVGDAPTEDLVVGARRAIEVEDGNPANAVRSGYALGRAAAGAADARTEALGLGVRPDDPRLPAYPAALRRKRASRDAPGVQAYALTHPPLGSLAVCDARHGPAASAPSERDPHEPLRAVLAGVVAPREHPAGVSPHQLVRVAVLHRRVALDEAVAAPPELVV